MLIECLSGLFAAHLCLETLTGTAPVPTVLWSESVSVLLGAVSSETVRLRVHAPAGTHHVMLEYWPKQELAALPRKIGPIPLGAAEHSVARVDITDLRPDTAYNYRVLIDGRAVVLDAALEFRTQPALHELADAQDFSVAMGSCAYTKKEDNADQDNPYGNDAGIFDTITDQRPDMMLWLGDNLYLRKQDIEQPGGMADRYRAIHSTSAVQRLLRSVPNYAVWDDHDYGPNDAGSEFALKEVSLALFQRFWANPSYGLPDVPGVFTRVSHQDVDFFLLDDRWYRDGDNASAEPRKAMLGKDQLAWLRRSLLDSTASYKVIVNGTQMLNEANHFESWSHFDSERSAFLRWLDNADIEGVLFISGDRHHTEVLRRERPGRYPLYELTCSPLAGWHQIVAEERDNPQRLPDTLVAQSNFCRLDFSGPREARVLTIRAFDNQGGELWALDLPRHDLTRSAWAPQPMPVVTSRCDRPETPNDCIVATNGAP
jgi:alkaline phosphatase D